jgi:NADPH:quinone reductase-like Zn-dependent oxidoreductase
VLRITGGKGVNIVVDGASGELTGQALAALAFGGSVIVAGYAGARQAEVAPDARQAPVSATPNAGLPLNELKGSENRLVSGHNRPFATFLSLLHSGRCCGFCYGLKCSNRSLLKALTTKSTKTRVLAAMSVRDA